MNRAECSGEKFLDDFLQGERNFRGLILKEADLSALPRFQEAVDYSKRIYSDVGYSEGVDFSGAQLTRVKLPGMCLTGALFDRAELTYVAIPGGFIDYASFDGVNIKGLDISNGSLSCGMFKAAQVEDMNLQGTRVFETGFCNTVLLNALGIETTASFQTSSLKGVLVDPATYEGIKKVFPVHSQLVATDVPEGSKLPNGTPIPPGSKVLGADYYLEKFLKGLPGGNL